MCKVKGVAIWNSVAGGIFLILTVLLAASLVGCRESSTTAAGQGGDEPVGRLMGSTGCKKFTETRFGTGIPSDQDCMDYYYDGEGMLLLKHINAGFNCCPIISADVTIEGGTITIEEIETLERGGCRCLCLFDLDYMITNLEPGAYTIVVIEPYRHEDEELLEFEVDLTSSVSGMHCEQRKHYPWDVEQSQGYPVGSLIEYRGCKSDSDFGGAAEVPRDESCAEYEYFEDTVLRLVHYNAVFNCCPEIHVDVSVEFNTITIMESETLVDGGCDCLCLFDLFFEVRNLPPAVYTVTFEELYLREGDEKLEFKIDLLASPSGRYCVHRPRNP